MQRRCAPGLWLNPGVDGSGNEPGDRELDTATTSPDYGRDAAASGIEATDGL